ncbi:hypothetical protein BCR43DRAFT_483554 [Syncephalastrum racemosum]|uniref:Uncharacterized protein n=1 Tax=Syncephalastrum racemosum TaxID=13706 RepID=A0A1X2HVH4_SYNRA|nr:hypothetical protein BCR43DRAFT_483554 [Syncephalastrum racemosum]
MNNQGNSGFNKYSGAQVDPNTNQQSTPSGYTGSMNEPSSRGTGGTGQRATANDPSGFGQNRFAGAQAPADQVDQSSDTYGSGTGAPQQQAQPQTTQGQQTEYGQQSEFSRQTGFGQQSGVGQQPGVGQQSGLGQSNTTDDYSGVGNQQQQQQSGGQASLGDRVKGGMEKMAGKLSGDPSQVQRGENLSQGGRQL